MEETVAVVEITGLVEVKSKIRNGFSSWLGCLVKDVKIKFLKEIYLFSLPIKESEIIHSPCIPKGRASKEHANAESDSG